MSDLESIHRRNRARALLRERAAVCGACSDPDPRCVRVRAFYGAAPTAVEPRPGDDPKARLEARAIDPAQDLALVRRALAGVPAALDEICVRLRCIGRIVSSRNRRANGLLRHHDLEDLVGEVNVTIWSQLAKYAGIGSLEAWIHSYCDHAYRNARRRRWRDARREQELAGEAAAPQLPESGADDTLHRCLQRLSEIEQRVIARRMAEQPFADIAAELGMNLNTVKSHNARALKSLHECCGGGGRA